MNTLKVITSLLLVSTGFAANEFSLPLPVPPSDDALLVAIAEVETGNNSSMVGRHGERTRLQITPATWVRYSLLPHSVSANNPEETDRVARAHLTNIRNRLKSRGLPETPFFIAAAWNVGPNWRYLPSRTVDYADRVANLVQATPPSPVIQLAPPPPNQSVAESNPPRIDPMAQAFEIPTSRPPFRPIVLSN